MLSLILVANAAPVDIEARIDELATGIATIDANTCGPVLNQMFRELEAIDPATVDRTSIQGRHSQIADRAWTVRLGLQDALHRLEAAGPIDEACVTGARRIDIATRYLIDHLLMEDENANAWLTTDDFGGFKDLRSGDILVTRGAGLSSAGIAHIGQIDSQFSHNAMVHIDADGNTWTVEAYLERGALTQPLDTFLHHGLGRIAVIRHGDQALAAKAAKMAYERIKNGKDIGYDEAFDSNDNGEQLFCSEIGPWAFAMAGGPRDMPLHATVFPQGANPRMFEAMGIEGDLIAAPADLLFDPRFSLIGEWRELSELEAMRRHDATVEALFTWMEEKDYALDLKWSHRATVDLGLALRRTPMLGRLLSGMVHPDGDRQFLVAGLALQEAGEALHKDFAKALDGQERPSLEEMHRVLEDIRVKDLAKWRKKPRKAGVHSILHPAE